MTIIWVDNSLELFFLETYNWFFIGIIIISYIFRSIFPFSSIWWCFKWFISILLLTLTFNFAKKNIKTWWEKD